MFLPSLARPVHLGSPGLSLSVLLLHLLLPSHPPVHRHPHRQKFHRQPKLLSEVKATDDTCQVIYFIVQENVILYMMKPSLLPIIYQILCHQATVVTHGFGLYLKAKTLVFSFLHSLCQLRPVQDKNIYTENCRLDRGLTNQHRTIYACVGKKSFETAFEKTQQTLSNTFLAPLWKKTCAIVERPDLAWSMVQGQANLLEVGILTYRGKQYIDDFPCFGNRHQFNAVTTHHLSSLYMHVYICIYMFRHISDVCMCPCMW